VLLFVAVTTAARPRYGGTLRVETSGQLTSVRPANAPASAADAAVRQRLWPLVYETLVTLEAARGLRPLLALSWESEAGGARWRFRLRPGVVRHDGTPLDAATVTASLGTFDACRPTAGTDAVVFQCDRPIPDLPWELARLEHAVVIAQPGRAPTGTGPFAIEQLTTARLLLRAHDAHWEGRPFLDAVDIRLGRPALDQIVSLEAGRADIVDVGPQHVRRVAQRRTTTASQATDLIALVFNAPAVSEPARRALALTVDRSALCNVVLQRQAQPASTLLPAWVSGYAAVVSAPADRVRARGMAASLPAAQRTLTLAVDRRDPLLPSIAERLAVDAREAGLTVTISPPTAAARSPQVWLVRTAIEPTTPDRALDATFRALGVATGVAASGRPVAAGTPVDAVHRLEADVLEAASIVPLVHLPQIYGVDSRVDSWLEAPLLPSGAWNFARVWLRTDAP
jgi:MarR-like DNA-binding transcriptional regulator SgrR of sgrS sRNA